MTQANKKIIKILTKAKNELNELWEKLDKQRENLKDEIYEKYPADVYGIKADSVFDRKSEEINEDVRNTRMAFIGMRNFLEEMQEKVEGQNAFNEMFTESFEALDKLKVR